MPERPRGWQSVTLGDDFPVPAGPYSPAVRAGNLLFVSGQVPKDTRSGALLGSDVATQARGALENLRRVLGAAGAVVDDVVSVTVYLADESDCSPTKATGPLSTRCTAKYSRHPTRHGPWSGPGSAGSW